MPLWQTTKRFEVFSRKPSIFQTTIFNGMALVCAGGSKEEDEEMKEANETPSVTFVMDQYDGTTRSKVDMPTMSALSFSDSSNGSERDVMSLFGEAIASKETMNTTSNTLDSDETNLVLQHHQQQLLDENPPFPALFPMFRPCSSGRELNLFVYLTGENRKASSLLPPRIPENSSAARSTTSVSTGTLLEHFVSSDFLDIVACPCCQQCLADPSHAAQSTVIEPYDVPPRREKVFPKSRSLSLISAVESDEESVEEQLQLNVDMMTGFLKGGARFRLTRILVEGSLHKKGTGHDWLGSRSWKSRWARLAMGHIDGYGSVPVPLLCTSWHPSSAVHSTVIVLDSTVVMAVDKPSTDKWNTHRFEIRHASSRLNSSLPVTRTFTALSNKGRDAWVYAISQALLSYEKEKAIARKLCSTAIYRPQSTRCPSKSRSKYPTRAFDEIWMGERFVAVDQSARLVVSSVQPERRATSPTPSAPPTPYLRDLAPSPPRPMGKGRCRRAPKTTATNLTTT